MSSLSRRQLLQTTSCGFGYMAMAGLYGRAISAATPTPLAGPLALKPTSLPPRAKHVIFMCMGGGPAQLDTFDYKPQVGNKPHSGSAFRFDQHGDSGLWISELFPELARHADKLCLLNGMICDSSNHAQSYQQLHTGERLQKRPSLGSWVLYGLGTENQDLPGFINLKPAKPSTFSSAFLPSIYQGMPVGMNEDMRTAMIHNIDSDHLPHDLKRRQLDLAQAMNQEHRRSRDDAGLEAVIESLELSFRMQATAPELLDTAGETAETLERYGVGRDVGKERAIKSDFGRQCLLARRFIEAGVRFVQLNFDGWDQHTNHREDLAANCLASDRPIAALLEDLELRGLLDETLLVWGGEFGRPGLVPDDNNPKRANGTGHQHRGFTFWLAGGGVKRGHVHGRTNEIGSAAVEGQVHFRDLHATILHLLGLDHDRLAVRHGGRDLRLTGVEGGKVVHDIIA